ncbi:MAG: ATP-grasp domain-containing protein [Candidatus Aminicenantaceae bacterium]
MARLFEYQSKNILKEGGVRIPEGKIAFSPEDVYKVSKKIGKPVVLKIQVWFTGRAGIGGIEFAETPEEAEKKSRKLLGMKVKGFVVDRILVEEKLWIMKEYFAGLVIDDSEKCPVLIFSSSGGTGIEEIARKHPEKITRISVDVGKGVSDYEVRNIIKNAGFSGKQLLQISDVLTKLYEISRRYDARSAEMNPLVLTKENLICAADCHLTIDDYAVFRHPELGIEVAREFDRPPTELEKIAYEIEEKDYRGTFYFFQMADGLTGKSNYIGFHGAGGGGSMMSMDSVLREGYELANFCDTSGNPPASKVYRAAKIILSQKGIMGYFASGSGVASQEQFHSARGMVKAFLEEKLEIPAVIRLGGNYEEKAIEILSSYLQDIPGTVEGYGRDDSPEFCAKRLKKLIEENEFSCHEIQPEIKPDLTEDAYSFETMTGKIFIDQKKCIHCQTKGCIKACAAGILKLEKEKPVLSISREEAKKGKCTECLACELFCSFYEKKALYISLPIPGLKEYKERLLSE